MTFGWEFFTKKQIKCLIFFFFYGREVQRISRKNKKTDGVIGLEEKKAATGRRVCCVLVCVNVLMCVCV